MCKVPNRSVTKDIFSILNVATRFGCSFRLKEKTFLHFISLKLQNNFLKAIFVLTARSQMTAVPSVEPVANMVPCGENLTSLTA